MENTYLPVLIMMLLSAGVVLLLLSVSIFLGPKVPTEIKDDPFECGTIGAGDPKQRFGVKFYLVGMIFILFDVEIIFLFPWAVNVLDFGWPGFWVMMPFLFILTVGLVYEWKRGVLEWL